MMSRAHRTGRRSAWGRPPSSGQPLQEQRSYGCGVGLAAHLAHHRADERPRGLDLAVPYLLGRVRICGDRLVDGRLERAGVGDDSKITGSYDLVRLTLASQYPVDDLPRQLVVDRAGVDELLYGRDLRRRDVQLGQLEVR